LVGWGKPHHDTANRVTDGEGSRKTGIRRHQNAEAMPGQIVGLGGIAGAGELEGVPVRARGGPKEKLAEPAMMAGVG